MTDPDDPRPRPAPAPLLSDRAAPVLAGADVATAPLSFLGAALMLGPSVAPAVLVGFGLWSWAMAFLYLTYSLMKG